MQTSAHHGIDDNIHRAVAAGCHDYIIVGIHSRNMLIDIPGMQGAERMHLIAPFLENTDTYIQVKFKAFIA